MAEKIIYEVALEGIANTIAQLGGLENRLSSFKFGGISALNKELEKTERLTKVIARLAPTGNKSYNKNMHIGVTPRRWMMVTAGWQGVVDEPLQKWQQSWSKDIPKSFFGRKNPHSAEPTNWMAELQRAKNRVSGDWGSLKQRRETVLKSVLGDYTPLLEWSSGAGFRTQTDGTSKSTSESLRDRDRLAEMHRAYYRNLHSTFKAGNDFYAPTVYSGGVPAVQPNKDYIDVESWYKNRQNESNTQQSASSGMANIGKTFGKLGRLTIGLNFFATALRWFGKNINAASEAVQTFSKVTLQAEASWRQLRESHAFGVSMSSLAAQWKQQFRLGGDAASASALWGRLSSQTAMIGYGGNGGSMMEAARLFGVNIRGSGAYGFATPDEFMRNVVKRMSTLPESGRRALATTLGLDPRQYWAVSHGEKYYDWVTNRKTLLQSINGTNALFSEQHQNASRNLIGAIGDFTIALKELGGVLGEAVLPMITIITDTLTGAIEVISSAIKPFMGVLGSIVNLFSTRFWATQDLLGSTPTNASVGARMNAKANNAGGNVITFHMGDISLNSLGLRDDASEDEISEKFASIMWNKLGEHLTNNRR